MERSRRGEIHFQTLKNQGIDYIHTTEFDAAQLAFEDSEPLAALAKRVTNISIIANGQLENPSKAAEFLEKDNADFISLGKGALANPNWPQRVKQDMDLDNFQEEILWPKAYIKDCEIMDR